MQFGQRMIRTRQIEARQSQRMMIIVGHTARSIGFATADGSFYSNQCSWIPVILNRAAAMRSCGAFDRARELLVMVRTIRLGERHETRAITIAGEDNGNRPPQQKYYAGAAKTVEGWAPFRSRSSQ